MPRQTPSKTTPKAAKRGKPAKAAPSGTRRPRPLLAPTTPLITYLLSLPGVTEDIKWGDNLCLMVGGKMFAIFDCDSPDTFAFKCTPEEFDQLTERPNIIPAPYAARFHWVKVMRKGALKAAEAKKLVANARSLVLECLPTKKRAEIERSSL
jgi:predicted DNA-binding protein (MmcQ/YjbR family)